MIMMKLIRSITNLLFPAPVVKAEISMLSQNELLKAVGL